MRRFFRGMRSTWADVAEVLAAAVLHRPWAATVALLAVGPLLASGIVWGWEPWSLHCQIAAVCGGHVVGVYWGRRWPKAVRWIAIAGLLGGVVVGAFFETDPFTTDLLEWRFGPEIAVCGVVLFAALVAGFRGRLQTMWVWTLFAAICLVARDIFMMFGVWGAAIRFDLTALGIGHESPLLPIRYNLAAAAALATASTLLLYLSGRRFAGAAYSGFAILLLASWRYVGWTEFLHVVLALCALGLAASVEDHVARGSADGDQASARLVVRAQRSPWRWALVSAASVYVVYALAVDVDVWTHFVRSSSGLRSMRSFRMDGRPPGFVHWTSAAVTTAGPMILAALVYHWVARMPDLLAKAAGLLAAFVAAALVWTAIVEWTFGQRVPATFGYAAVVHGPALPILWTLAVGFVTRLVRCRSVILDVVLAAASAAVAAVYVAHYRSAMLAGPWPGPEVVFVALVPLLLHRLAAARVLSIPALTTGCVAGAVLGTAVVPLLAHGDVLTPVATVCCLGVLIAAYVPVARRLRSLTAIPADHAVFVDFGSLEPGAGANE